MRVTILCVVLFAQFCSAGCIPGVYTRVSAMRGVVVDPAGKPVEGAMVSAVKVPGESGEDFHYTATTDQSGQFLIKAERHLAFYWLIGVPPDAHDGQPRGMLRATYLNESSAPVDFGATMGNCRLLGLGPDEPIDVGFYGACSQASDGVASVGFPGHGI